MSVRLEGPIIILEGVCRVEDAEPLLRWLQADPGRTVDLSGADHLHASVLQVLMALRPALKGSPRDPFIRDWVVSALADPRLIGMAPQRA
ncbi:hypothetical protein [Microvirga solisilvae]|uniref:hypothetical protein n=1 Tax=Microvirga solisilvae TaxID=2919498 RepID=UPI001FAFD906|nr:hypothetical protein [Microvirga solisilvae]